MLYWSQDPTLGLKLGLFGTLKLALANPNANFSIPNKPSLGITRARTLAAQKGNYIV